MAVRRSTRGCTSEAVNLDKISLYCLRVLVLGRPSPLEHADQDWRGSFSRRRSRCPRVTTSAVSADSQLADGAVERDVLHAETLPLERACPARGKLGIGVTCASAAALSCAVGAPEEILCSRQAEAG